MFATVITTLLSLSQMPAAAELPDGLRDRPVRVVLQATETYFVAENLSLSSHLLLFGTLEHGTFASVSLPPLARVVYPFALGAGDEVLVEIVLLDAGRWSNSGALSVRELSQAPTGTLWIETAREYALGWVQRERGLEHLRPLGGLLPASAERLGLRDLGSTLEAAQVPVITPDDDREGNEPPKIDPDPLPPV